MSFAEATTFSCCANDQRKRQLRRRQVELLDTLVYTYTTASFSRGPPCSVSLSLDINGSWRCGKTGGFFFKRLGTLTILSLFVLTFNRDVHPPVTLFAFRHVMGAMYKPVRRINVELVPTWLKMSANNWSILYIKRKECSSVFRSIGSYACFSKRKNWSYECDETIDYYCYAEAFKKKL